MSISVDIEKKLGSFHLRVAFEAENETMALLGASGCGKSMTLRCIAGIVRPDRGRIVLNGRTLFDSEQHIDLPPQQRGVGYLFQQYALFPHMTVEKNVCAGTREGTRAERKAAAQRILRTLGLEELAQRLPANLSGGQQQRHGLVFRLERHAQVERAEFFLDVDRNTHAAAPFPRFSSRLTASSTTAEIARLTATQKNACRSSFVRQS